MPELSRVFRSSFPDAEDAAFRTDAWRTGTARSAGELKPLHPTVLHAFAMAAKLDDCDGVTLLPEEEPGETSTRGYRDLYHAARRYAGALTRLGVAPGDRVLIVLPTSFEFLLAFFGAQLVGAVPVPSYPPALLERAEIALDRLVHIGASSGSSVCVTSRQLRPLLGELGLRVRPMKHIVCAEDLEDGDAAAAPKARASGKDPGFIQYTSGSTGRPKGVLLSHHALVANVHAAGQALQVTRADRGVSWLPLYHDMGLIGGLLFFTYWRLHQTLMSPLAFLARPVRWLRAIHEQRATLSIAPNFAYGMCVKRVRPAERQGLDLSSWRATLNGAEPVNMRTVHDFTKTFEPYGFRPDAMLPVYGLAEASVAVTFPRPGEPLRFEVVDRAALAAGKAVPSRGVGSTALVGCGAPVPGHEVLIVDGAGTRLQDRDVGNIVVRGPSLMTGYYADAEATRQVLRDGWLWTGDLGYFADGQLYIAGRAKDLIIVRGRNHYAEDLERQAERVDGVRPGGVAAFGVYDDTKAADLVVIVCETRVEGDAERAALVAQVNARVAEHCGLSVDEVVLVPPGSIPKTSSGKRQRPLCRELYLSGDLGRSRTGKLKLAMIFVRSGAGFLVAQAKRLLAKQRAPG